MAQTEFRAEVINGPVESSATTITMIANDANILLHGPVILAAGSITDLPQAASVASAGSALVIGVCVKLPRNGTITATVSTVEICIQGICKLKVTDATVLLNDPLETSATAGKARVQPQITIDGTSTATLDTTCTNAFNNIRKCFAIALTTVSSGADSIIACYVNINCVASVA